MHVDKKMPIRKELTTEEIAKMKETRISKGFSVQEAADIVGISKSRFSRIELGQTIINRSEFACMLFQLKWANSKQKNDFFLSRNHGRKTTDDYERELAHLEETGADKQTIKKLKRRISYSRWYENKVLCL
ncbi:helix-turn-helix transcriptional regulator [Acidithiobacillus thiooxidans]|uniref:helix-turn-helix domain-containing protein n=1 Tax=Acidithiobacillus thiooxidans TaxID=930 RepID=UPI001C078A38|nr:helix-turn-helix transcriptional regulator [Acidithiobacillus thiooxidans]MBU2835117.1 helix-turn-helix transcriptional regulator [Acidithiobacillus thiooxidans]